LIMQQVQAYKTKLGICHQRLKKQNPLPVHFGNGKNRKRLLIFISSFVFTFTAP